VIVFGRNDDEAIGAVDCLGSGPQDWVGNRRAVSPGGGDGIVEERQGKVAKIEELDVYVGAIGQFLRDPLGWFVGKAALARASDDDGDAIHMVLLRCELPAACASRRGDMFIDNLVHR
jgi:hypothetical protein